MTSTDAYWHLHALLMDMKQAPNQLELKDAIKQAGLVVIKTKNTDDQKEPYEEVGKLVSKISDMNISREEIVFQFATANLVVMFGERDRGDGRKVHYGEGKQPWDTALERGWAAAGAAFNIVKYLRRTKQPERDIEAAKVYYGWLKNLSLHEKDFNGMPRSHSSPLGVFRVLIREELKPFERDLLNVTAEDMVL